MARTPDPLPASANHTNERRTWVRLLLKIGIGVLLGTIGLSLLSAGAEKFQDAVDRSQ
jgi:hypothetical protein